MSWPFRNLILGPEAVGEPIPALTDFEAELKGPEGAEVQRRALARLEELLDEIQRRIREGIPKEQFRDAETIRTGIVTAHDFLSRVMIAGPQNSARKQ